MILDFITPKSTSKLNFNSSTCTKLVFQLNVSFISFSQVTALRAVIIAVRLIEP